MMVNMVMVAVVVCGGGGGSVLMGARSYLVLWYFSSFHFRHGKLQRALIVGGNHDIRDVHVVENQLETGVIVFVRGL